MLNKQQQIGLFVNRAEKRRTRLSLKKKEKKITKRDDSVRRAEEQRDVLQSK
jgi:hypothetical protein